MALVNEVRLETVTVEGPNGPFDVPAQIAEAFPDSYKRVDTTETSAARSKPQKTAAAEKEQ